MKDGRNNKAQDLDVWLEQLGGHLMRSRKRPGFKNVRHYYSSIPYSILIFGRFIYFDINFKDLNSTPYRGNFYIEKFS